MSFQTSGFHDNIVYEHLKFGDEHLKIALTYVFIKKIDTECIPKCFKTVLTVTDKTLHKGKGKSTKEPKNLGTLTLLLVESKFVRKDYNEKIRRSKYKTHKLQNGGWWRSCCKNHVIIA